MGLKDRGRARRLLVAALVPALALVAPALAGAAQGGSGGAPTVFAKKVARVVPKGKDPVLLEGGAFGPDGQFYFANVLAKAGQPKLLRLNVETKHLQSIYTNKASTFTSTQFDSSGRLWTTDYEGGTIDSLNPDGTGYKTNFGSSIEGRKMIPDDISFDPEGDLFVSDSAGTPWDPTGRIVRFDPNGQSPKVVMSGLAAPNGVTFTPDYSKLWVSEYSGQQEDLFTLDESHGSVTAASVGMRANTGVGGFDSNTVDAAGNVYQCVNEGNEILVWDEHGTLLRTIRVRQNLGAPERSATNLAIKPGTRQAYVVVGGQAGGFVYTFQALAKGIAQSNGGSAQ